MERIMKHNCPNCKHQFEEFKVEIIESERGWGSKIDEIKMFNDEQEALNFIEDYNKDNNLPVTPDWYMYARKAW
jgi:hypothetical protein